MKYFIIPIVFLSIAPMFVSAKSTFLEYTIQKRDTTSLLIIMSFTGDKSGNMLLTLPNEWAGQKMLFNSISQIATVSNKTTMVAGDKPFEYHVNYMPGAKITLSYVLTKGFTGRLRYPLYFRPVIEPDYFFFEGYSGLILPDIADTVQLACKITYKGFAKNDFIGNSFFANESSHAFNTNIKHLTNGFFLRRQFPHKNSRKQWA